MEVTSQKIYNNINGTGKMKRNIEYVTAIDIGTTKIVAIAGRKTQKGKIEILGIGVAPSHGVRRGVVLNIEQTAQSIMIAVKEAEEKSGVEFKEVFVGIAGQHIKSSMNRAYKFYDHYDHEITQEDINELTQEMSKIPIEPGEEIIHIIPQTFMVDSDHNVKHPIGISGRKLDINFHIVVGEIASARNIAKCVERAGLKVVKLILEPLASSEAILTDDEKEAGVAMVDIGGGTTDLAVFHDGILRHTSVIPFGGDVISKDIKEGANILLRNAESLKVQYGSALGDLAPENKVVAIPGISGRDSKEITFKTLAYIIQARMEEIIEAFAYEIELCGFYDKLGAGIALTGGGALLKHLPQLVKFKTGLDVRMGNPNENFSTGMNDDFNLPFYSTGLGLIVKGYEYLEKEDKPLISSKVEKQKEREIENTQTTVNKNPKERKFINNIKESIYNIFEDKDNKLD